MIVFAYILLLGSIIVYLPVAVGLKRKKVQLKPKYTLVVMSQPSGLPEAVYKSGSLNDK